MNLTIYPSVTGGRLKAISSKSAAHRLFFCAAFADKETVIYCPDTSSDIDATLECLRGLGATVEKREDYFCVSPIKEALNSPVLDCKDSGTTYRFLLPVIASLGCGGALITRGRLPKRPVSPLYETLVSSGISLSPKGSEKMNISGTLQAGDYTFEGNVSSQFASGMLLAFCASKKPSTLTLTGKIESSPYIDLTVDIIKKFGVKISVDEEKNAFRKYSFENTPRLVSSGKEKCEGDYSSASFWLTAGAIGKAPVSVSGLNKHSVQADREILMLLSRFGAKVEEAENEIKVSPSVLRGIEIDASQIPDLVPILSVAACAAHGETLIYNASRLRYKESDRLRSVNAMITSLGGEIYEGEDFLRIKGCGALRGGNVICANDHRIAMSAAVASLICESSVTLIGAECTSKSYPDFFADAEKIGFKIKESV